MNRRRSFEIVLVAIACWLAPGVAIAAPSCKLARGSHGRAVRAIQRALGIAADGRFGPVTARALRRYQRREGLPATGCADTATRRALRSGGAPAPTRITLTPVQLEQLQQALGVAADGALGPQTRRAIRAAQRRLHLRVDGRPSMRLLSALGVQLTAPATAGTAAGALVSAVQSRLGAPYGWGATGPDEFDCLGLVQWAAASAGIELPRTTFDQYTLGTAVEPDAIAPGDLVFFDTDGTGASHVAVAIDATHAISATAHGVRTHEIFDAYWGAHYIGARRVTDPRPI